MGGAPHLDKVAVEHVVRHIGLNQESCMAYLRTTGYKFRNSRFRELYNEVLANSEEEEEALPGFLEAPDKRREKATGRTFVFTCAQNNTALHDKFWQALMHYVADNDAKLHVSRFVYNKKSMAAAMQKPDTASVTDVDDIWYDKRIEPYASDKSLQIAPTLVWCGELNIIPTRVHPLSTLKTYTRGNSAIIPHVKMRMDSVPTMKDADPVFLYTTGSVTKRNYIQRVAGQVAEFHHVFGAIVVEVDDDGNWWARQINADINGCFYDLDTYWTPDGYTDGHRLAAVTHGDIHGLKADFDIIEQVFEEGGILDQLMPHEQFMHDTIDFMPRNHHNIKDPHFLWEMHKSSNESVEYEFQVAGRILQYAHRSWCKTVVVVSNHDMALCTWLKNTTAFSDPANVEFWLKCNLHVFQKGGRDVFLYALDQNTAENVRKKLKYVREDESYSVYGTNIEGGVHGHLGPNGARGNPLNLRTVGKANTAHTHSAGIVDGIYTAGVYGKLDMGYNKGLSSWSHSFIVTYLNGKRAILTIKKGKAWRDAHVKKRMT